MQALHPRKGAERTRTAVLHVRAYCSGSDFFSERSLDDEALDGFKRLLNGVRDLIGRAVVILGSFDVQVDEDRAGHGSSFGMDLQKRPQVRGRSVAPSPEARLVTVPLGGGHADDLQVIGGNVAHDVAEVDGDVIASVVSQETLAANLARGTSGNDLALVVMVGGVADSDYEHLKPPYSGTVTP